MKNENGVQAKSAAEMWNEKYAGPDYFYGFLPNDFLKMACLVLKPGSRVLSLGEGEGRNAVYLASLGHKVTAVDASHVAREKALRLARERGVEIDFRVMDLQDFESLEGGWDGIVSIWCHLPEGLRARVHRWALGALVPGGHFFLEAYTPRQLEFGTGGPKDIGLLMKPDDIKRELFASGQSAHFDIFQSVEREVSEGTGHIGPSATLQILLQRL